MYYRYRGYILIVLLIALTIMGIGLMVAVPVWETQIQREKEDELIFRGRQYVEAVRLYQLKNPGSFPKTLDELLEEKCIRRLYKDPMTPEGEWNLVLHQEGVGGSRGPQAFGPGSRRIETAGPLRTRDPGQVQGQAFSPQSVLVAPLKVLSSLQNPQILGVVSPSKKKSFKLYNEQESYDKWLFFYGQEAGRLPEVIYYGQRTKPS